MFLWITGRDGTRSKVTGNFLVNALHAFHRFNRRYHVKNSSRDLIPNHRIFKRVYVSCWQIKETVFIIPRIVEHSNNFILVLLTRMFSCCSVGSMAVLYKLHKSDNVQNTKIKENRLMKQRIVNCCTDRCTLIWGRVLIPATQSGRHSLLLENSSCKNLAVGKSVMHMHFACSIYLEELFLLLTWLGTRTGAGSTTTLA